MPSGQPSFKLKIDLHKLSLSVSLSLPICAFCFFAAGTFLSFYFHFLTVAFLFLTVIDLFYRFVQTRHTILRNFGLLGQGRYILESVGPELRQYLFANDTEERPFNRAERTEVYRKAQKVDSAASFGSLLNFDNAEIKVRHSMFPTDPEDLEPYRLTFGAERGLGEAAYTLQRPFIVSAMSFGALSANAVRTIARGAKLAGIPMNTGEGGWPKYHLMENCDLIFQMGTAKFGVRQPDGSLDEDRFQALCRQPQVRMIEIKLSQGAKPGKGGLLPKEKITPEIAELRNVEPDRDVVSPAHHAECTDAASTVAFIGRVQALSGLPVGIKLCLGRPEEFRAFVLEMQRQACFPDYIAIDGAEGGTGAAPKAFADSYGVPLLPALMVVRDILEETGLRDRILIIAGGKLVGPARQITAMALGAQAVYTARGFMLAIGCIQALECGQNTCPIGITSHDPTLTRGLVVAERAPRVRNYVDALHHDFEALLGATGCRSVRDLTPEHLFIPEDSVRHPLLSGAVHSRRSA